MPRERPATPARNVIDLDLDASYRYSQRSLSLITCSAAVLKQIT